MRPRNGRTVDQTTSPPALPRCIGIPLVFLPSRGPSIISMRERGDLRCVVRRSSRDQRGVPTERCRSCPRQMSMRVASCLRLEAGDWAETCPCTLAACLAGVDRTVYTYILPCLSDYVEPYGDDGNGGVYMFGLACAANDVVDTRLIGNTPPRLSSPMYLLK